TMEYYRLEKKLKKEKKPEIEKEKVIEKPEEEVEKVPEDDRKVIFINKIVTNRSEILSIEEIQQITHKYEGKSASIKVLFEIVEKINELYKTKNYIAAKAILPRQKVESGIIKIRLIEAHVGEILVENNKSTKDSFLKKRISLNSGDLIKLDDLERDIIFFNRVNDVKIRAELKPGEEFGTTDCILRTEEPQKYHMSLFLDNAGRKAVGRERLGLFVKDSSLLGYRDPLTISALTADGTLSGSASYDFPIDTQGTRLGATYGYNQIKVKSGPLEDLDIGGDSYDLGINLSHPFIVKPRFKLDGFIGFHKKRSRTEFADVTLFETEVRSFILGCDFQSFDDHGSWYCSHKITQGRNNYGDDKNFFKYNVWCTRLQRLKDGLVAVFRGSGQIADSVLLPSSEQFQIGGQSTVRGYSEGLLIGDDGYLLSAELMYSLTPGDKVKGFVFVDHGGAFPYKGAGESIDHKDFLTSVGFGLNINFSKYLTGRFNFGVPLGDREDDQKSVRFHFYLQSNIL
ncbi:MAG: ShlB/FhaC/HecB family hemolysin secretion/activation protein, partial [Candidatus Caldatribacteriota bacterium]|nr:ShlB/FhaC/HecB family hemolysin secretion/activation protein [Candidatus Caldatribacteriota bacterium]